MNLGKVLIIDDSVFVQNYLTKLIYSINGLELAGVVSNGIDGAKAIMNILPDVVILDLEMNDGDGLYVLQQIEDNLSFGQRPFVLIYSSRARYTDPIFKKAIDFGFCDFILKVEGTLDTIMSKIKSTFTPKILSGIEAKKTRSLLGIGKNTLQSSNSTFKIRPTLETTTVIGSSIVQDLKDLSVVFAKKHLQPKLLLIGASTGGPQVIRKILQQIDNNITIPIVIVQHMPEKFTASFALELTNSSSIPVYELKHNMALEKGKAYVFPGGTHGKLHSFGSLLVYYSDRNNYENNYFKPSVNLAIDSLSEFIKSSTIGVILSGMGQDGAIGMKQLKDKGSIIFAQDKKSSAVWGMPGSTVQKDGVDVILSQDEIGQGIVQTLAHYGVHPKVGGIHG